MAHRDTTLMVVLDACSLQAQVVHIRIFACNDRTQPLSSCEYVAANFPVLLKPPCSTDIQEVCQAVNEAYCCDALGSC